VVDIESGDYEVADDDLSASDRMLARRPDAKLYGLRVGRDYAYRLVGEGFGLAELARSTSMLSSHSGSGRQLSHYGRYFSMMPSRFSSS
jgi:hypothetical protein